MFKTFYARGFTILETAIVMTVVAVMLAMALGAYKMLREAGDRLKTGSALGSAVSETVNYAVTYGRLPSAAQFDSLIGEKYGVAYVPEDNLTDLTYSRTNSMCLAADSDPSFTAFSISKGADEKTVTLEELKSLMNCFSDSGPLRVITETLPPAAAGENYRAEISASGGRPFYGGSAGEEYEWCVEPLLNGGESGVYGDYLVRKDRGGELVSLNCGRKGNWFRGSNAVFRIDDFDDEGIIGVSSIPLRIYVRDDNGTSYRDVSLSSAAMAYYPPPEDGDDTQVRIYETDTSGESPIRVQFWGEKQEIINLLVGMIKPFVSSCVWWNEPPFKAMKLKNNIVGAYMLMIIGNDRLTGSVNNGFTVVFIPTSEKLKPTLCGDAGTGLGYGVNTFPSKRSTGALQGPSIGVELDIASDSRYNDEWIKDPWAVNYNKWPSGREPFDHVAVVSSQYYATFISDDVADKKSSASDNAINDINGVPRPEGKRAYSALQASNWHGADDGLGNRNDSCGYPGSVPKEAGCFTNEQNLFPDQYGKMTPGWLSVSTYRRLRIELDGRCDATCARCDDSVKDPKGVLVSAWMSYNDVPGMNDMTKSFSGPKELPYLMARSCKPFPKEMNTVRMGLAVGLGDNVFTATISSIRGGVFK